MKELPKHDLPGFIILRDAVQDTLPTLSPDDVPNLPTSTFASEHIVTRGAKLLIPAPKTTKPFFLLDDKATQRYIDSLKKRFQHDPITSGLASNPIEDAAIEANALVDEQTKQNWRDEGLGRRADYINLQWVSMVSDNYTTLMNAPYGDPSDASVIIESAFDVAEIRAFALAQLLISADRYELMRTVIAAITLGYGETMWNPNLANQEGSTASGLWQSIKAADVEGLKEAEKLLDPQSWQMIERYILSLGLTFGQYGFKKVMVAVGLINRHDRMISKEWSFTDGHWIALTARGKQAQERYAALLNADIPGYAWLQFLYHAYDSPQIVPQYEKSRVAKDYLIASLIAENPGPLTRELDSMDRTLSSSFKVVKSGKLAGTGLAQARYAMKLATSLPPGEMPVFMGLKAPDITSRWSKNRSYFNVALHRKISRPHRGMDLRARTPKPIFAPTDGFVHSVGNDPNGWGKWVNITLPSRKASYLLAHLSDVWVAPKVRTAFKAGEIIALTGQSGNARNAPHLHLEYYPFATGKATDPEKDPFHTWRHFINP